MGSAASYALLRSLADQALKGGISWRWDVSADWQMVKKGARVAVSLAQARNTFPHGGRKPSQRLFSLPVLEAVLYFIQLQYVIK